MSSRGDSSKAHHIRGVGPSSRLPFSNDELRSRGWKIEDYGKSFKWTNSDGVIFYSSKALKAFLEKEKMETSESEYEPLTSDDCLSSPEKNVPLPYEAYRAQKR